MKKAYLYVWSALVKRLIQRPDSPQDLQNMIKQHLDAHSTPRLLGKVVKSCTAKRQKNKERVTITASLKADLEPMCELVKAWLIAHGGNELDDYDGPPPKGPLFRRNDFAQRLESYSTFDFRLDSCDSYSLHCAYCHDSCNDMHDFRASWLRSCTGTGCFATVTL